MFVITTFGYVQSLKMNSLNVTYAEISPTVAYRTNSSLSKSLSRFEFVYTYRIVGKFVTFET
jgi:hypothetical protein